MSDHEQDGWGLLLPFDTDDPVFARGVEIGRLWTLASDESENEVAATVHAESAEMVMRIAEATSRTFSAVALDERWIEVTLR